MFAWVSCLIAELVFHFSGCKAPTVVGIPSSVGFSIEDAVALAAGAVAVTAAAGVAAGVAAV
jgi:hypothetical protein